MSEKKKFDKLSSGMELIRGGVEINGMTPMACNCSDTGAYSYGSAGSSGCACGCPAATAEGLFKKTKKGPSGDIPTP